MKDREAFKNPSPLFPNTYSWLYIYIQCLFSRERGRAVWEGCLLRDVGFVIQTDSKTNLNRALKEEIVAFYWQEKKELSVHASCCWRAGLVGPCTEKLSFMCTQALLRASVLTEGIFGSSLKKVRNRGSGAG